MGERGGRDGGTRRNTGKAYEQGCVEADIVSHLKGHDTHIVLRAELASSTVPGFTYRYTGMVEPQRIFVPGRTGRDNIN